MASRCAQDLIISTGTKARSTAPLGNGWPGAIEVVSIAEKCSTLRKCIPLEFL